MSFLQTYHHFKLYNHATDALILRDSYQKVLGPLHSGARSIRDCGPLHHVFKWNPVQDGSVFHTFIPLFREGFGPG